MTATLKAALLSAALSALALHAYGQASRAADALREVKAAWAKAPVAFATPEAGFEAWQRGLRARLAELLAPPPNAPEAIADALWLVPERPRTDWAVLCFGGSGQSKETVAELQGRFFFGQGFAVCCVANPPDSIARFLLEMGWSWLGYAVAAARPELKRLRTYAPRVLFSGFSLGTEPMMALGNLEGRPGDAYVYNDFLCRCKERLLVLDREPNGLRNIIPGYFSAFDFPDLCAALSESPLIFTEGGLDRDAAIVARWHPENVEFHHQPRFASGPRFQGKALPSPLTRDEFFRLCNVDPKNHNYKTALIAEWMRRRLGIPLSP